MRKAIDVECHALRAGLKPAMRLAAPRGEGRAIVERYRGLGAAAVHVAGFIRDEVDLVYVARTQADAESARSTEAPLVSGEAVSLDVELGVVRALGRRLGYPECCIERCCERAAARDTLAEAYVMARGARVAAPHWELNDQLFAIRARLLSHHPCRYDCAPSLSYARAVYDVLAAPDPHGAQMLAATLRRSIAVDPSGARAFVRLDGLAIVEAEPVTSSDEHFSSADAVVLAFDRSEAHAETGARIA